MPCFLAQPEQEVFSPVFLDERPQLRGGQQAARVARLEQRPQRAERLARPRLGFRRAKLRRAEILLLEIRVVADENGDRLDRPAPAPDSGFEHLAARDRAEVLEVAPVHQMSPVRKRAGGRDVGETRAVVSRGARPDFRPRGDEAIKIINVAEYRRAGSDIDVAGDHALAGLDMSAVQEERRETIAPRPKRAETAISPEILAKTGFAPGALPALFQGLGAIRKAKGEEPLHQVGEEQRRDRGCEEVLGEHGLSGTLEGSPARLVSAAARYPVRARQLTRESHERRRAEAAA